MFSFTVPMRPPVQGVALLLQRVEQHDTSGTLTGQWTELSSQKVSPRVDSDDERDGVTQSVSTLANGVPLQTISLAHNEIAGLWAERLGGEWATHGTYTTSAMDAIVCVLEKERCGLRKRGGIEIDTHQSDQRPRGDI